jgi:hypothetical protein
MTDDKGSVRQKQSQSLSTSHSTKVECEVIDRLVTVTYRDGGVDVICRGNRGGFCEETHEDCYVLRSHDRGSAAQNRAEEARARAEIAALLSIMDDEDNEDDEDF